MDNTKKKAASQLVDLDVDRVDLVDKPATGRSFLLFKNADAVEKAIANASREFPIEDQPGRGPRVADEGEDTMGRAYDDGAFIASYASLGGTSPIPLAGAGPTMTETPDSGAKFPVSVGGRLPSRPATADYVCEDEPTRLPGGMRLLRPALSGIPEALDFKAPAPTTVLKGVFTDVVLDPRDEEPSNFFEAPQSDAVAKSSGSMWRGIVKGFDE